jgi:hypothetical protein
MRGNATEDIGGLGHGCGDHDDIRTLQRFCSILSDGIDYPEVQRDLHVIALTADANDLADAAVSFQRERKRTTDQANAKDHEFPGMQYRVRWPLNHARIVSWGALEAHVLQKAKRRFSRLC